MSSPNEEQIAYWNGRAGEKWSALQSSLDVMLAPASAKLKERAGRGAGLRLLDIGCGTGETCAMWLAGGADVTGVDVSEAMLALAGKRTQGKARLIQADASTWKSEAPFDLAVSRFGVMFFDDPHRAFANLAQSVRPGGRLLFVCWRARAENPWATVPLAAIQDLLPPSPPPAPHAPGPFGLADKPRLNDILSRAGFEKISIEPFDFPNCAAAEGGAEAGANLMMQIGPSGAALSDVNVTDDVRAKARARLVAAFAPYENAGVVALPGATWVVEAVRAQ